MPSDRRVAIAARGDREIVVRRLFDAPRRLVFRAWTDPTLLPRWFGQRDWTMPVCEMDVRPGGCYRYVMRDPNGREIVMRGEYREVAPPERLVSTEYFEGFSEPGWRPEDATVGTATFEERDGQTTWTLTVLYPSRDVRDAALALEPAWDGMDESFDRLIEVVRTLTA